MRNRFQLHFRHLASANSEEGLFTFAEFFQVFETVPCYKTDECTKRTQYIELSDKSLFVCLV